MDKPFTTPIEALQKWAQERPDQLAFLYLEQGEEETERLTFAELERSSRRIGAALQSISRPGERALLVYPPGLDFVKAMYGCLFAGIVPIPTNPPGMNRSLRRLAAIAMDAQASIILAPTLFRLIFEQRDENINDLTPVQWIDITTLEENSSITYKTPDLGPDVLAFIQYTSGSTDIPKGVMISYRNLSYNHDALMQLRELHKIDDPLILNWAPLFHDMGLIVGVFQGVFDGNASIMMSPVAFIQQPVRWLKAISKYRATNSGGPNFAYDICINKIKPEDCENLDLSNWHGAYNSSEPVREQTLRLFTEKFAPFGFRPEAFYPCYGLAEATLLVSGYGYSKKIITHRVDRNALEEGKILASDSTESKKYSDLVSCGRPLINIQVAIVNPTTKKRCLPDEIGEIWLSGGNISEGYWNKPQETEVAFRATIKNTGEGPFLRTGDLGFMNDGYLYVTGRCKDMILIRGRNYYPQDIEVTVQKVHPVLQPGGGIAFSIQSEGMEHLVVIQEVREKYRDNQSWEEIIKKIRFDIAREHGIRASSILLIERSSIPKTSSGKLMRSECKRLFLDNQFDILAEWRAPIL